MQAVSLQLEVRWNHLLSNEVPTIPSIESIF